MSMNPDFEIKYLELTWYDRKTLTKVIASVNSLRVEYDHVRNLFEAETTIYPKSLGVNRGHLAIRFLNKTSATPFILLSNDDKRYLSAIQDSETGFTWWIFADKWNNEHKQWQGIAPNIVGTVRFILKDSVVDLSINGSNFTSFQLEQYLQAFKNDLWELILDENSVVQGEAKESKGIGVNEDVIQCIKSLVTHAEKVLMTPKVELREIQELKIRKSVKPVKRTFMELSSKSNQRLLTSRATKPSYDVAENRYILFALERCYRIIKQISILASNKKERYQHIIQKLKNQNDLFNNSVTVNRDLVVADLEVLRLRANVSYWQELLRKNLRDNNFDFSPSPQLNDIRIKLEHLTNDKDGFFFLIWNYYNEQWEMPNGKFGILSLRNSCSSLVKVFQTGMELEINCSYTWKETDKAIILGFEIIHSIELLGSIVINNARIAFENEVNIGKVLARNNWIKNLSKPELEEQEKEKESIRNRINYYAYNLKNSAYVDFHVKPKLKKLSKIISDFRKLKIKSSSHFPNSMTFVQNPHYQAVYNGYRNLRDITNLTDESLLLSLEKIDEIGLVNMPMLYERWCLIQIIKTLKENFRFTPQDSWKRNLIDAVQTNKSDIDISLINAEAKRFIVLSYEKKLANNKRPDFTIDLTWYEESDLENTNAHFKRFVLDAKFYDKNTFDRFGGMMSKIDELYHDKDYSEGGVNPVFVIHPCVGLMEKQITSQSWGKYSYLGEVCFSEREEYCSHNKGAILLNPIDREIYNDELQRLLGMFIQYKLESSDTSKFQDDRTLSVPICIRCGSTHFRKIEKSSSYRNRNGDFVVRTPRSVWLECSECNQFQIHNHCSNTEEQTRLIKNGLYWSYHSARAIEPFNMKCPCCGAWGAW